MELNSGSSDRRWSLFSYSLLMYEASILGQEFQLQILLKGQISSDGKS